MSKAFYVSRCLCFAHTFCHMCDSDVNMFVCHLLSRAQPCQLDSISQVDVQASHGLGNSHPAQSLEAGAKQMQTEIHIEAIPASESRIKAGTLFSGITTCIRVGTRCSASASTHKTLLQQKLELLQIRMLEYEVKS